MSEVIYAYFDEFDLPRAYAIGPNEREGFVREIATQMLEQYVEKKNELEYNLTYDMFTLKKAIVGMDDWEVVDDPS